MKIAILSAFLAVAGFVSAQGLSDLPACSRTCVGNSIPAECNLQPACICSSATFIDAISCCVSKACSLADQNLTLSIARSVCTPAGVTTLPVSASCAPGATASGGSASASGSGSMSITSTGGSVAQSASSVVSSLASSASASVSSAASSASSAASESATATSSEAGAERMVVQGLGALGAGLLGVAGML